MSDAVSATADPTVDDVTRTAVGSGQDAPSGPQTGGGRMLHRLLRQPVTMLSLTYLVALLVVAVFAPTIAPYGETEQNLDRLLEGPTADHILGTDALGRDTLSRMIFGSRVALQAAIQSIALAAALGIPTGLFIGYRGGWWDRIAMRLVDASDVYPAIVLASAVIAVLGRGLTNAMIAVGILFIPAYIRLTRALVLGEREKLYVDAAHVSGLRTSNILVRQILPNVAAPLIVQGAILIGSAVLIEASLTFLGLGIDVTRASWGGMLSTATQLQYRQPLLPWPPGLAITFTVLAFNLLGDGLRDALGGEKAISGRAWRRRLAARRQAQGAVTSKAAPLGISHRGGSGTRESTRSASSDAVLSVEGLSVCFPFPAGEATIIEDVSLTLRPGETLGLVGESGSGKTMTGLAMMGLLPKPGYVASGSVRLRDGELVGLSERQFRRVRGSEMAMIFQDPAVALSPVHTVGRQLTQSLRNHHELSPAGARARAAELLSMVGVSDPRRLNDYAHQFSGGMAQRVVIAMALAGEPNVLIADEPTTALDVTTQRQILDLLRDLKERLGMAMLLITHDLGVVADLCDRASVMYAGQVVEEGGVDDLFTRPRHPYTSALLAAMPRNEASSGRLPTIDGRVPPAWAWPDGCRFHPRCTYATAACKAAPVPFADGTRCVRQGELTLDRMGRRGPS